MLVWGWSAHFVSALCSQLLSTRLSIRANLPSGTPGKPPGKYVNCILHSAARSVTVWGHGGGQDINSIFNVNLTAEY